MNNARISMLGLALAAVAAAPAHAAVKLTAIQIISTEADGRIQGVGAHRFKTTQHGGQPCIFVVDSFELDKPIINGPDAAHNGVDLTLSAGTHVYTIYAEKYNSYTWTNYTLHLFFDLAQAPQISAMVPLNVNSTQFFPPVQAYANFTENLAGRPVQTTNSLVYKSGQTEVRLVGFHFSNPPLYNKDRVGPFEARSNQTLDYVGQFRLDVTAPPAISAGGVVNGASFAPKVAPGSLFSIFGSDLATGTANATALPLPLALNGTSVTIGGKAAPLLYVSANQVNAQVPYEVALDNNVPVVVTVNGVASLAATVSVIDGAPGIFQWGNQRAVAQNEDYTLNDTTNPASAGSYVVAYVTGSGRLDNPVPTGGPAPSDPLSRVVGTVLATVNGQSAEVAFAGMTPGYVGLTQVNLKVPNLAPGEYPLVITINGERSNAGTVSVK